MLREPLLHFLLIGTLLFVAIQGYAQWAGRYTIHIGRDEIDRTARRYAEQYGALPTRDQLRSLIDDQVLQEIYLREGRALGLDRDDEIVRRRVSQKFAFLQQDLAAPAEPTAQQLRAWFAAHRSRYDIPAQRSFEQIYFAIDQRGDAAARALAIAAVGQLATGRKVPSGDPFPGPSIVRLLSAREIDRLFGAGDFARSVFAAAIGKWVGPLRSGYGWHVVRVTETAAVRQRRFEDVEAEVRDDWRDAEKVRQDALHDAALRRRYSVEIADIRP